MKKVLLSMIFMGLFSCGLFALDEEKSFDTYTSYDEGWDDGWDSGFDEGQDDVCDDGVYHIDEDFDDDGEYDEGWKDGYIKGYDYSYDKGCVVTDLSYDEGWDDGYDLGFKEGKDDACNGLAYHIDEDFDDDGEYDEGWKDGYIEGYEKGWKSCDITKESMDRVSIAFRDHGYSNFSSKVITSKRELQDFLDKALKVSSWQYRSFTNILYSLLETDFKKKNILFYRITETSGSISLKPQKPTIKNGHAKVKIQRKVPEIVTDDMAYYALLYLLDKSIKDITFDDGNQEVVVENIQSDMIIPKNCRAWYDGCNYCSKSDNGAVMCTKRACFVYRPEDFRCNEWE